jgi:hypothetical protein
MLAMLATLGPGAAIPGPRLPPAMGVRPYPSLEVSKHTSVSTRFFFILGRPFKQLRFARLHSV